MKPGNAGGGKEPWFKTDVGSGEGAEIGKPSNSEQSSEAANSVTCESEGRTRVSLLCAVRQDLPRGYSGACLCLLPRQQGGSGGGRPKLCGGGSVWGGAVARGTGASPPRGELSTGSGKTSISAQAQWQASAVGHSLFARQSVPDGGNVGSGADLRGRPAARTVCLPRGQERTGCGQGGASSAEYRTSGSRRC